MLGSSSEQLLLLAIGGLLLTLVILLVVLLIVFSRRNAEINRQLSQMGDWAEDSRKDSENLLMRQGMAQRQETQQALLNMNDSLLATLSSMSQSQSYQLNALQKQLFEQEQALDVRQHRMHQMTEENLQRYELRASEVGRMTDEQLEKMRTSLETGLLRLQQENAQKLEEIRRTVDEKLNDTLSQRLGDSFAQVSKQLDAVYRSLGEVHSLATGVGDLKRVLGNVKTRGVWGEVQLGRLLSQTLTSTQYAQNVAVKPGTQERVEYAVKLPGRGEEAVFLAIDSKFPQEDYIRLVEASEAGDAARVDAAQKALLSAVRVEAKRIGKYIEPPYTTDFAVMFLPMEGLYAEVMRHADVAEQIRREQRVLIASPSTLQALLNSLQMGFRTLAIERRSAEVWQLLGNIKTDFAAFAQTLQRTQEKLQQASESIDTAFAKTRTIQRRLGNVEYTDALPEDKQR